MRLYPSFLFLIFHFWYIDAPDFYVYNPAISLLGICLEKIVIQKDYFTPIFIVALFTIAKTWKQTKYPLTGELIKIWYIYIVEYYSAIEE